MNPLTKCENAAIDDQNCKDSAYVAELAEWNRVIGREWACAPDCDLIMASLCGQYNTLDRQFVAETIQRWLLAGRPPLSEFLEAEGLFDLFYFHS